VLVSGVEPTNGDPLRVTRLEENAAFTERTIESLSSEIAELNRRMKQLTDRLASMEQRIVKMMEEPEEIGE